MTKKRALKMIMSMGVQRNEAQQMLLIEHRKGLTNKDALAEISFVILRRMLERAVLNAGRAMASIGMKAKETARAFQELAASAGGVIHEDLCD